MRGRSEGWPEAGSFLDPYAELEDGGSPHHDAIAMPAMTNNTRPSEEGHRRPGGSGRAAAPDVASRRRAQKV